MKKIPLFILVILILFQFGTSFGRAYQSRHPFNDLKLAHQYQLLHREVEIPGQFRHPCFDLSPIIGLYWIFVLKLCDQSFQSIRDLSPGPHLE